MDEYKIFFDVNSKIAWNRQRMRELYEQYSKTERYYPIFLAYLGFISLFTLNIVKDIYYLGCNLFTIINALLVIVHIGIVLYNIYLIFDILSLKSFGQDLLPNQVYKTTYENAKKDYPENSHKKLLKITRNSYLNTLENELARNLDIYSNKKRMIKKAIKWLTISFIVYLISFAFYQFNLTTMESDKKKTSNTPTVRTYEKYPKTAKSMFTNKVIRNINLKLARINEDEFINNREDFKKLKEKINTKIIKLLKD